MKTFMPNEADIVREWLVVDATDKPAGRLAPDGDGAERGAFRKSTTIASSSAERLSRTC